MLCSRCNKVIADEDRLNGALPMLVFAVDGLDVPLLALSNILSVMVPHNDLPDAQSLEHDLGELLPPE